MGKFANEREGQGVMIGPGVQTKGTDGWDALGKPVPMYRRAAAMEHVKDMYGDRPMDKEKVFSCIEAMCNHIERDNPHAAMERALAHRGNPAGIVDAIGVYRLLAVLLTAQKPRHRVPYAKR